MDGRKCWLPSNRPIEYETYDASYVEAILHQQRRQRELPSPTEVLPRCPEWIEETDYEPTDPASYDRLLEDDETDAQDEREEEHDTPRQTTSCSNFRKTCSN